MQHYIAQNFVEYCSLYHNIDLFALLSTGIAVIFAVCTFSIFDFLLLCLKPRLSSTVPVFAMIGCCFAFSFQQFNSSTFICTFNV